MEKENLTGYTSIDKPYLKTMPIFSYNPDIAKKSIYNMILQSPENKPDKKALNFYGKQMNNRELYSQIDVVTKAYKNLGVKKDDIVFMFCLNTPEMVESLYALNRIGAITEWFNPQGITPGMIKKLIIENNTKVIVTIDVLYNVIKEAIKDTSVQTVIVNSVKDSFNAHTRLQYDLQVNGISTILNSSFYRNQMEQILVDKTIEKTEKKIQLTKLQQLIVKLSEYAAKQKIMEKSSYYYDNNKDERFISWLDFISKYYYENTDIKSTYDLEKTSIIVHTGGTTGPVKRVAMTDYAMNSAIYQSSIIPLELKSEYSLCQIVPPIVAWGLESHHVARYYNMNTHLIATYDRNEFVPIIKKTQANVYFTVPSFVKRLIEDPAVDRMDLSCIKFIGYGGESMEPELDKKVDEILKKHGSTCRNQFGYGQNEEFGCFAVNFDFKTIDKNDYGCCGWPMPGNDYIIIDNETLKELPYGTNNDGKPYIGEICVTGPTIMKEYIGTSSPENKNTIMYYKGTKYIKTGDQGYIDTNGKLWYCTRNQRIIRTQTGKIFTNLLENIINRYPEVLECCVVAAPSPTNAKEASCHIVLKEKYLKLPPSQLEELINNIVKRVEYDVKDFYTVYIPGTYEFRSERIPLTSSMRKMDFKMLEEINTQEYNKNGGKALQKVRINIKS